MNLGKFTINCLLFKGFSNLEKQLILEPKLAIQVGLVGKHNHIFPHICLDILLCILKMLDFLHTVWIANYNFLFWQLNFTINTFSHPFVFIVSLMLSAPTFKTISGIKTSESGTGYKFTCNTNQKIHDWHAC